MHYILNININLITADYILGGLAMNYRQLASLSRMNASNDIKALMIDILYQLTEYGIEVMNPRNQFNSYAVLVDFEKTITIK